MMCNRIDGRKRQLAIASTDVAEWDDEERHHGVSDGDEKHVFDRMKTKYSKACDWLHKKTDWNQKKT